MEPGNKILVNTRVHKSIFKMFLTQIKDILMWTLGNRIIRVRNQSMIKANMAVPDKILARLILWCNFLQLTRACKKKPCQ